MAQAQAFRLCTSPSSIFLDNKSKSTSISVSSSSRYFKVPKSPFSHYLSSLSLQSETSLHTSCISLKDPIAQMTHVNSPEDAKFKDPVAKSSSLSKTNIWVNPRSPVAKQLRKKSFDARSSILKIAKSLDSCNPTEQHVSEILKGLGGIVSERDAVLILNKMVNPQTALLALQYFQHKIGPAKHVVLYNVILKLFREIKDFEGAEKLFDEMLQGGIKPDIITFSTIISCAAMCSLPHKAVMWFEKMPSFGIERNENLSSAMIYAYARTGNGDMAWSLYDRAKREKCHIDRLAFTALIKIHGMSGNYDGCLNVYKDMKVLGVKPNVTTYNTLLYALGKSKMSWKAKAIYEEMINNGVSPNGATYAALLEAYSRARFSEEALGVYKEMKDKGMHLETFLYNMLLDMCADVGYIDEAVEIFEDMKSSGTCKPDSFTFSSLINMYSCSGKVSEAEGMLNEMINCGFKPNIFVVTSLVNCYGKHNRTDDVVKIFNQLLDLGVVPDDRICDCLMCVLTQTPKEELGKIIDCVEKANPKLGSVVIYLVEEREGDKDLRKEASELFDSINADVKKSVCNCLIDLCVNLNMPARACELLDLGLMLEIYANIQSRSQTKWSLHLKKLSLGAALTALRVWTNDLSRALDSGEDLPPLLGINTGLGNHKFSSEFESHLKELNAPFHQVSDEPGWFMTTNIAARSWLQSRGSTEIFAALNSTV